MKVKAKLCAVCQTPFIPKQITPVCSYQCARKFNEKKEVDKRVREMKKDVQSLNDLRSIARSAFQTWVRMRDKDLPCISCGKNDTQQWDGGHFLKAEIYTGLIFEEINCNKQCCYCNGPIMQGNVIEYRKGMIKKYGQTTVDELEARADLSRIYKFDRQELTEITFKYRAKIKELKTASKNVGTPIEVKIVTIKN